MLKKLVLVFAILALVASAGTVPAGPRYKITLDQPSVVKGTELKAGDYRLTLGDAKVTITLMNGKNVVETPVKVETTDKKFGETVIGFTKQNGKSVISEIRLGGTKTRLVFN